ncbi:MAG TPA: hypothetical protein PKI49_06180 [Pseudomonadota bacterium]|jgi:hypothetical protein|nr:hypothetical protein [Pseudomonadota bacterium]HNI58585.1 hypothetical protein [Pseudomonadota bacterium]HNN49399.1 hypothetical protein [Pseudomonadota bacterium]HNO68079.1 hypothetical protein [Pseudomonadota bacterium]
MPTLLEDIYNVVTFDPELRLVRQLRTNERIPSLQEMHRSYTALSKAFSPYTRYVLLADLRKAPGNNLPDAEMLTKQLLAPPLKKFRMVASLVSTATGKLQVARMWREMGVNMGTFQDEAEALAYLGVTPRKA